MEAIGQLTGGIAQDFNNLLMVISGNLEIAQRALSRWTEGSREGAARGLVNASAGAQKAATLTQRLLAFARKQPFATTIVSPNALISGTANFLRRSLGENIDLDIIAAG